METTADKIAVAALVAIVVPTVLSIVALCSSGHQTGIAFEGSSLPTSYRQLFSYCQRACQSNAPTATQFLPGPANADVEVSLNVDSLTKGSPEDEALQFVIRENLAWLAMCDQKVSLWGIWWFHLTKAELLMAVLRVHPGIRRHIVRAQAFFVDNNDLARFRVAKVIKEHKLDRE